MEEQLEAILATLGLEYHRAMPSSVGGRNAVRKATAAITALVQEAVKDTAKKAYKVGFDDGLTGTPKLKSNSGGSNNE